MLFRFLSTLLCVLSCSMSVRRMLVLVGPRSLPLFSPPHVRSRPLNTHWPVSLGKRTRSDLRPTPDATGAVLGAGNDIWFADDDANELVRVSDVGAVTTFSAGRWVLPNPNAPNHPFVQGAGPLGSAG